MVAKYRIFEEQAQQTGARSRRQMVVAVTANGAEGGNDKFLIQQGFDYVCPKPVASTEIGTIIAAYLQTVDEG